MYAMVGAHMAMLVQYASHMGIYRYHLPKGEPQCIPKVTPTDST